MYTCTENDTWPHSLVNTSKMKVFCAIGHHPRAIGHRPRGCERERDCEFMLARFPQLPHVDMDSRSHRLPRTRALRTTLGLISL